ncbi:L,D-transpeptidase [Terribacillus halophilus]|jgi:lipoprotein-anchoring transpeptidase ErfK/SrfK|uniref:L,D-transpeptidase n=1 Tax=Terribacillus halophilus TaxID=361279 RepID=UPI0009848E24|nr:L,D-transpeptidase [Terribacillus halophilus]
MRALLLAFTCVSILSPLWPFGENPMPGRPLIIVNKTTNQLALVDEGEIVKIYPVATGKTAESTPEGLFMTLFKTEYPSYTKKGIAGGDEDNPLGSRWIGFNAKDTQGRTYGIHGTNRPESIGRSVSAGCIRMQNKDVEELYEQIPVGTKVHIVTDGKSFEEIGREDGAILSPRRQNSSL